MKKLEKIIFISKSISILIGLILFIVFLLKPEESKPMEPEFKIFSVCLEGKKFAIAMKSNAISITPILSDYNIQERCK